MLLAVNRGDISPTQLNDKNLKPSQIEARLVNNKAVNMNVIIQEITDDAYNTGEVKMDDDKFEINIDLLQQAVKDEKEVARIKKNLKNDDGWNAILESDGRGSRNKSIALMKLSDIRAVAASA